MPSNHLILCHPFLFLPSNFLSSRVFSSESALCIRWPKDWCFSFTIPQIDGETVETVSDFIFLGSNITADGDYSYEIKRHLWLGRKVMTNLDSIFKGRDITLPTKVHLVKAVVFPVVMYGLDCEESWAPNWCFWTVVLEKTLESPLDCKEIQQVHPKGDQPWDFFGRTDAKAETPVLWPPLANSWLIGKDSDAVRDWGQEEKGTT